ncbi:threonine synthase [Desulforhopalus sp. IMCC35007]|uniref:threonine synthase n=1 Tax=Desulforhopalus sp. IMCC35007 TaxID=2569543 RepID=UPI0010AE3B21|nr:threonine synthase [Desulforhopalus sp. IMCC35007]TKB10645.1 threonine synthase [Desulforhopalus sp. IMCC35007]
MQYLSTRGGISPISFTQAVMMGLAEDGGLLLPRTIPRIGSDTFASWQQLSYPELAFEIMSRFIDDIPGSDLRNIINASYASFTSEQVTPLVHHGDLHILELFHGPTLAFKDVALQFLGNLFEYMLKKNKSVLNIIGATSGDTGSAAIYGVRGKQNINIFILHPHKRVSAVQERQMTTVLDANVFNIAIDGSFDDGQSIVKRIFNDIEFKNKYHLGAINSINWARVLAQVVYYVYSCIHVATHEKDSSVDFAIPTGNFGDIFAGYIAKKILPPGTIRQLVLATNDNDILSRFVNKGDYSLGDVKITSSPSMDIQAASNFERYLYYLMDSDPNKTKALMEEFAENGRIDLSGSQDLIKRDFVAVAVSEEQVANTIADFYQKYGYILDPHTAVGVKAAQKFKTGGVPIVCLATAHPAKFGDVVEKAINVPLEMPESIIGIIDKEARCELMAAEKNAIQNYIAERALQPAA